MVQQVDVEGLVSLRFVIVIDLVDNVVTNESTSKVFSRNRFGKYY